MGDVTEWVQRYLDWGFTIIPVVPLGKKAAVEWKKYQAERPGGEDIEEWMGLWLRGYNVAVVCGAASGGLVVMDIDAYRNNKLLSVLDFEKLRRETLVVETPSGGYHVYFSCSGPTPSFNLSSGGDVLAEVKGDGRYVLAPPSRAVPKTGGEPREYRVVSEITAPARITTDIRSDLVAALKKRGIPVSVGSEKLQLVERAVRAGKPYRGRPMPCVERLMTGVSSGFRHEAAMRMASFYLNLRRYRPEKAWAELSEWNAKNRPPLPSDELYRCFRDVLERGYVYGCSSLRIVHCDRSRCPLRPYITISEDAYGYDWLKTLKRRARRRK